MQWGGASVVEWVVKVIVKQAKNYEVLAGQINNNSTV